jgi:hypothetical protein
MRSVFYLLIFFTWSSSFLSSLLQMQLFNNASCLQCFFVKWECEHSLRYELWTLCINTRSHYSLASKLVLHNLQHKTTHLFPVLVLRLLNFKVYMNNLYSSATSTTNGCLERQDHHVCCLPLLMAEGESWILTKLESSTILTMFFFFLAHLCHCMLLMRIVRI